MLLAASLHGPGTPGVSTSLSPLIERACSISTYWAMVADSPSATVWPPAPARGAARASVSLCQKRGQKEKPPKAPCLRRPAIRGCGGRLVGDHHLRAAGQRECDSWHPEQRLKVVGHRDAYDFPRIVIARRSGAGAALRIPAGSHAQIARAQPLQLVLDVVRDGRRRRRGKAVRTMHDRIAHGVARRTGDEAIGVERIPE